MLDVTSGPEVSRVRYVPESQDLILEEALLPPVPSLPTSSRRFTPSTLMVFNSPTGLANNAFFFFLERLRIEFGYLSSRQHREMCIFTHKCVHNCFKMITAASASNATLSHCLALFAIAWEDFFFRGLALLLGQKEKKSQNRA